MHIISFSARVRESDGDNYDNYYIKRTSIVKYWVYNKLINDIMLTTVGVVFKWSVGSGDGGGEQTYNNIYDTSTFKYQVHDSIVLIINHNNINNDNYGPQLDPKIFNTINISN